jgi:glycosyltransferase involved in cell wall biosynthesis
MCKVSIIIPCYNQANFLQEAVESVLLQTFKDFECIIVNDGSSDNTEEIALNLKSNDLRIKYLKKENGGLSSARNAGIAISKGKYILPLDADDKIGLNYITEAVEILESHDSVKIVYCDAEFFGEKSGKWELPTFEPNKMLLYNHIFCSAIFRKKDFNKTKGYDREMKFGWEDWEFWLSLLETGGEVYKLNTVRFYYRIRNGSMVSSMTEEQRTFLKMRVYLNHFKMYDRLFSDPISLYEENLNLKLKCERLENSKYYKLGRILLLPLKIIYNLFRK